MHLLRAPGGCPWDAEQTHESLLKHLLEEAYEVADAVRNGTDDELIDELGDLLLQPFFHAEIGEEQGRFNIDDVANAICEKLVRRHPHVFGEAIADDPDAVLSQWDAIKAAERGEIAESSRVESETKEGSVSYDPALPAKIGGFPALMAAQKLQKRAAKVGFDWPEAAPVVAKVREETEEVAEAMASGDRDEVAEEIGDLLFAVVNLARKSGHDAELLLHRANDKFARRFRGAEAALAAAGIQPREAGLERWDEEWERAKLGE